MIETLNDKLKKKNEELDRQFKEREEALIKKRKEENIKLYEQLRKKREEDLKRMKELKQNPRLPTDDEYLYKKLEEKYTKNVLMPILEEKKEQLAKKRNQFKSMDKNEFINHEKKYELLMAQKEEDRKKKMKINKEKDLLLKKSISKYKTIALERQSIEEIKKKEEEEKRKNEIKMRREKMENYSHLIRDAYQIRPSTDKAKELQERIFHLKHPVRQHRDIRRLYDLAVINKRDTHSTYTLNKLGKNITANSSARDRQVEDINSSSYAEEKHKEISRKSSEQPKNEDTKVVKRIDYLSQMRKKREKQYETAKSINYDWNTDLDDIKLDNIQKYDKILNKVNLIEENAIRKEKILQAKGGTLKNPDMSESISDMFIKAIKAKLAVLDQL